MLTDSKLDFWVKQNYNVLIIGKKGCGKSSVVIDAFERNGLKWKYFSASTMDPWVDFIGVPKEKTVDGKTYLELIRPKDFQDDEVEAIFFDEFNRSHKKVRNAVLELIQFKSINGKKYNNLKIIWAAINPSDDDSESYDVEKLDPAQEDRFHIHVNMPYLPSYEYFKEKYGAENASAAISWWKELPDDMKNLVSPRRLDYALDVYRNNGDLVDVLHSKANPSKLKRVLKSGPAKENLNKLYLAKDIVGSELFLENENNYSDCIDYILKNKDYLKFFVPLMTKEKISSLCGKNPLEKNKKKIFDFLVGNYSDKKIKEVIDSIIESQSNYRLRDQLKAMLPKEVIPTVNNNSSFKNECDQINKIYPGHNTHNRKEKFRELLCKLPSKFDNVEDIELALDICLGILNRSQKTTVDRMTHVRGQYAKSPICGSFYAKSPICGSFNGKQLDIFDVINNCLFNIADITKTDYLTIKSNYKVVKNISYRLTRLGLVNEIDITKIDNSIVVPF